MSEWRYGLNLDMARFLMYKYHDYYTDEEREQYVNMVCFCHDIVESYWDKHGYGLGYFAVIKLIDPELDQRISNWSIDHQRRIKEPSLWLQEYNKTHNTHFGEPGWS